MSARPGDRPRYYPIFLNLEGKIAVVIGGGKAAERKAKTLIAHGADVTLIAPEVTEGIEQLTAAEKMNYLGRGYVRGDLEGAFVVVCSEDSEEIRRAVYEEASSRGQLINVTDSPELSNYIVPSVVRRGDLQIAISTAGAAPAVAKQLRKRFEDEFGEEWAAYVELLGELRLVASRRIDDDAQRKRLFEAAVDSDLFERVREGNAPNAGELYLEMCRTLGMDV